MTPIYNLEKVKTDNYNSLLTERLILVVHYFLCPIFPPEWPHDHLLA